MIIINKEVDKSFYIRKQTPKDKILLLDTLRLNNEQYINSLNLKNTAPHYTIDRDGKVFQHIDTKYQSTYLDEEYNKNIIVIALANAGRLKYAFKDGGQYFNWCNELVEVDEVFQKEWRNCIYWHKYTSIQTNALIHLIKEVILPKHKEININESRFHNLYEDEFDKLSGIICESNFDKESLSLNPHFENFWKRLHKVNWLLDNTATPSE